MNSEENFFIALDYEGILDQLRDSNIKNDIHRQEMISNLTLMAYNDLSKCEVIVSIIRQHWQVVSPSSRVLIVNLIHSIVTSVGGEYKTLLDEHIVDMFVATYEHATIVARDQLLKWRGRWDHYFSRENLQKLDEAVKVIDPNWPTLPPVPAKIAIEYEKFAYTKEILCLKKERDSLKAEIEQLQREKKRKRDVLVSMDESPQKKRKMSQVQEPKSKPKPKPAAKSKSDHKQMVPEPKPAATSKPEHKQTVPEPKPAATSKPEHKQTVPEPKPAATSKPEHKKVLPEPKPAAISKPEHKQMVPEPKPAATSMPEHKKVLSEIEQKKPEAERKSKSKSKDNKSETEPKSKSKSSTKTEPKLRAKSKQVSKLQKLRSKLESNARWALNPFKSKPKEQQISCEVKKTNSTKLELNGSMEPKEVSHSSKTTSTNEKSICQKKAIVPLPEKKSTEIPIEKPS